jgi:Translation initiation factor eIF3 subunit 135
MPPSAPLFLRGTTASPQVRRMLSASLYERLRPEFLRSYCSRLDSPESLSSDAFSSFPEPACRHADNQDVVRATQALLMSDVPEAARELVSFVERAWTKFAVGRPSIDMFVRGVHAPSASARGNELAASVADWIAITSRAACRVLHSKGVNLRFLGAVREAVVGDSLSAAVTRDILLLEMVARTAKVLFRRGLRSAQVGNDGSLDHSLKENALRLFNLVLGGVDSAEEHQAFWEHVVAPHLSSKFYSVLSSTLPGTGQASEAPLNRVDRIPRIADSQLRVALRTRLFSDLVDAERQQGTSTFGHDIGFSAGDHGGLTLRALWLRVSALSGMSFQRHVDDEMRSEVLAYFSSAVVFDRGDLDGIHPRIKSLTAVEGSMGYVCKQRAYYALQKGNVAEAERENRLGIHCFADALEMAPNHNIHLRNSAQLLGGLLACARRRCESHGMADPAVAPAGEFADVLEFTEELYVASTHADPHDAEPHFQLGCFYMDWKRDAVRARLAFDQALARSPGHAGVALRLKRLPTVDAAQS